MGVGMVIEFPFVKDGYRLVLQNVTEGGSYLSFVKTDEEGVEHPVHFLFDPKALQDGVKKMIEVWPVIEGE